MMYYSKVFLLSIVVLLSLWYVVSKAGVEEKKNIFSVELDIISPWDKCEELNETQSLCEEKLFASSNELANYANYKYIMKMKIGTNKKEFRVSWTNNHIFVFQIVA